MTPVHTLLATVSEATIRQQPATAYQKAFQADLAPHIQKAASALRKAAGNGFTYAPHAQEILKQIAARVELYCRCRAEHLLVTSRLRLPKACNVPFCQPLPAIVWASLQSMGWATLKCTEESCTDHLPSRMQ